MLFLSSLDNLLQDAYTIFQKGVDNFEIRAQNMQIFGQGWSSPLRVIYLTRESWGLFASHFWKKKMPKKNKTIKLDCKRLGTSFETNFCVQMP